MDTLEFATDTPITEEQLDVLKRIRRNIKRSDDEYALYFVECNLPNLRKQLINELDNTDNLNLLTLNIADYLQDESLHIDEWVSMRKAEYQHENPDNPLDVINIVGLERLLPTDSDEQIIQTVSELNWRRSYFQELSIPIIFWLPSYALALLANQASDFYDWYSDTFYFDSNLEQKELAVSQQVASLRHPRTNIAAHQYESKENKEKQLRQLNALLDETKNTNDAAHIKNQMGLLLFSIGILDESLSCFQASYTFYSESDNTSGMAAVLSNISQVFAGQGDYTFALSNLEKSLDIISKDSNKTGLSATLNNIGQTYNTIGNYKEALRYCKSALETCEELNDAIGISSALNNIASIYHACGKYSTALTYFKKSLDICEAIDDKLGLGSLLNNIASIYEVYYDYENALLFFERSLEICKDIGNKVGIATALSNIANVYHVLGNFIDALDYFQQSLIIDEQINDIAGMSVTLNNMSQVYSAQGDYIAAIDYLRKSMAICEELSDRVGLAYSSYNIGIILQKMDTEFHSEADKYLKQADKLAKELDLKEIMSDYQ